MILISSISKIGLARNTNDLREFVSKYSFPIRRYARRMVFVLLPNKTIIHDALGRKTHDCTQNLDITYNHLDLPEKVSRDDTSLVNDELFSVGVEWKWL